MLIYSCLVRLSLVNGGALLWPSFLLSSIARIFPLLHTQGTKHHSPSLPSECGRSGTRTVSPNPWEQDLPFSQLIAPFSSCSQCCLNKVWISLCFLNGHFQWKKNKTQKTNLRSQPRLCYFLFSWDLGNSASFIFLAAEICRSPSKGSAHPHLHCWIFSCGFCLLSCSCWIPLYVGFYNYFPDSRQKPLALPSDFFFFRQGNLWLTS